MVQTFGTAGRGSRQLTRRERAVFVAHLAGGLTGGAATGCVFAVVSATPLRWICAACLALVTVAAVLGDFGVGRDVRSWTTRQVPEHWRRLLGGRTFGFAYGLGLGVGVGTRIASPVVPGALMVAVVVGPPWVVLVAGICFGGVRAATHVSLARLASTRVGLEGIDELLERSNLGARSVGTGLAALTIVWSVALTANGL